MLPFYSQKCLISIKVYLLGEQNEADPDVNGLLSEVMKLPEKYRIVIHLFYYEDMPVKEIADILEISEGNVKTRLNRGRSMLKEVLEDTL